MKRIAASFKNRFVLNIVLIVLLVVAALICLQLWFDLLYNVPMFMIKDAMSSIIILFALILSAPFVVYGVMSVFAKITLTLKKEDDRFVLISSGVFSKTVIGEPESFEGGFGKITSKLTGVQRCYFRLKVTNKAGKAYKFFERVDPKKLTDIEVTPIKRIPKMLICDDRFPGGVTKIYDILLDYKEKTSSPFQEKSDR